MLIELLEYVSHEVNECVRPQLLCATPVTLALASGSTTLFREGPPAQNFGDYLPELLAKEFMLHPRVEADIYRLIGSVIDNAWILRDLRHTIGLQSGHIALWCCGMRTGEPLDSKVQAMCSFLGV